MVTNIALIFPAIIFLLIFFIKKWKKSKNISSMKRLPPGPKPLPIIGNLHLMTSPTFRCFRDLANHHGPIMHLKLGSAPVVVVSSPDVAKQIFKHHDSNFSDRPRSISFEIMWYKYLDIFFSQYDNYWRQMRKICINKLVSPRMVRSFRSIRGDEAARLVDSLHHSSGKTVNLTEMLLSYTSSITSRAAFGKACKNSEKLVELLIEALKMGGGFEIADCFPSSRIVSTLSWTKMRLEMAMRKADSFFDDVINDRRQNLSERETEHLVDVLLRIKEEEELQFPITNYNIKAVLFDTFAAGTETPSSIIDWTMVELLRNPNVLAKAQAEVRQVFKGEEDDIHKLKYLKLVIKETLRLHPPTPMLPRASRNECEINGYTIPAKMKVMINIFAMQRDPRYWKDPERFEPERFENIPTVDFTCDDFQFLPFGSGRRMCPAMMFGIAYVELGLAHLLYSFNWKLPEGVDPQDLDMTENGGITASRKNDLFIVATSYNYN